VNSFLTLGNENPELGLWETKKHKSNLWYFLMFGHNEKRHSSTSKLRVSTLLVLGFSNWVSYSSQHNPSYRTNVVRPSFKASMKNHVGIIFGLGWALQRVAHPSYNAIIIFWETPNLRTCHCATALLSYV
jgi:hypothetical protein